MTKTARYLICSVLILILIVGACCLYFIPVSSSPITITADAVKTGSENTRLETVPITLQVTVDKYLFRDDRLRLEISSFDDLYDIKSLEHGSSAIDIDRLDELGYYTANCLASSTDIGKDTFLLMIRFHEDLNKWIFFRTYRLGSNPEFGLDYYSDLDCTYSVTVK